MWTWTTLTCAALVAASVQTAEFSVSVYDASPGAAAGHRERLPLQSLFLRWPAPRPGSCLVVCRSPEHPDAAAHLVDHLGRQQLPLVLVSPNASVVRQERCLGGNFFLFSRGDKKEILRAVDAIFLPLPNFRSFKLVVFTRALNLTLVDRIFTKFYSRGVRTASLVSLEEAGGSSARRRRSLASALEESRRPHWMTLRTLSRSATIARAFNLSAGIRVGYLNMTPFFSFLEDKPSIFPSCTGYDCKIFGNLARATDAVIVYKNTDYGKKLANGSFDGDFRDLETGEIHVAGIPRAPFWSSPYFDYTYPHIRDNYCFMVGAAGTLPPEEILLSPFQAAVKHFILVSLLCLTAVLVLVRRSTTASEASLFDCSAVVFLAFICGFLRTRTRRCSEMTLSATLFAFNIVVVSCYQSSLYSLYTSPRGLHDLATLRELVGYAGTIYTPTDFRHVFESLRGEDDDVTAMLPKFVYVNESEDFEQVRDDFRQGRRVTLMMYESILQGVRRMAWFTGDDAALKLHVVPECLMAPVFLSYTVSRRISVDAFDALMARCKAAGLLAKWVRDTWYELEVTGALQHASVSRRRQPASPLRLRHLVPGFWALLLGHGVALGVFLLELAHAKTRQPQQQQQRPKTFKDLTFVHQHSQTL